jgi:hypothetical protein
MVWRTTRTLPRLDLVAEDPAWGAFEYLLDGAWRLLSLYSAIYQKKGDGAHFYDLATREFLFAQEVNGAHMLPLTCFADDYGIYRFERACEDRKLANRGHALLNRISESLVPVTSVVTDDLKMAARACVAVGNHTLADAILRCGNGATSKSETLEEGR